MVPAERIEVGSWFIAFLLTFLDVLGRQATHSIAKMWQAAKKKLLERKGGRAKESETLDRNMFLNS
jgi:hypothetical protein